MRSEELEADLRFSASDLEYQINFDRHRERERELIEIESTLFSDLDLSFLKKAFLSVEISEAMASERERESGVPRG